MTETCGHPCPICGEALGQDPSWCFACGWREGSTPSRPVPDGGIPPAEDRPALSTCGNLRCGASIDSASTSCPYCGEVVQTVAPGEPLDVVLPWATVRLVAGDRIALGRLPSFSPFASELARYSRVSRRHAIIHQSGGAPVLVDQESPNGTFCNGVRVTAFAEVILRDGDVISLAGEVDIRIRVAEQ